jgi:hypothetical protein
MDEYWLKSGNKELAAKKLNDDMDDYWAKRGGGGEGEGEGEGGDGEAGEGEGDDAGEDDEKAATA